MSADKLKLKHAVFEALLSQKKAEFEKISKYQQDQLESINEADLDKSEMIESQTENMMREMRTESQSLDHLKEEVNFLEDYKSFKNREKVGPSCIVKTNIGNFVVAVPEHEFTVEGEKFTGISTKSPIYEALEGKTEGDSISFNGQEIKISQVV
ncbi:hypothetical protein [Owenweeksia hongkongensis]|uniref:hypothetical protein n=1 Tax=Owenweeksia hongkongensis TaxID=253245 RepID=UPI003A94FC7F